jgi:hypothetical protein
MELNKGAVGIFVALCIIGGATGFYLATSGSSQPVVNAAPIAALEASPQLVDQPVATVAPAPAPVRPAVTERPIAPVVRRAAAPARPAPPKLTSERPPAVTAEPVERPRPLVPRADTAAAAPAVVARPLEPKPVAPAEPAAPQFVELEVPAESVIGLQVESALTSERAQVEDEVVARVSRDVRVNDRVAIPAGAQAHGQVTLVERGGRLRERARLGIRFTSIALADGTRVPLETETIYREGDSPSGESTAKIGGGAIGGAIIGGILGGAKGAVIGGSVGAGAGTAAVYAGGRNAATLPSGTPITVRLVEPATVTVEN